MPTVSTGNQQWDQSLNTLGAALFPDASKVAQGYYYGSEARKAQLEANRIVDQQNWKNRLMMGPDMGTAYPASPTWSPPNLPGAAPIANPPANLPMSTVVAGPPGANRPIPMNMSPAQAAAMTPQVVAPLMQGTPPPFSPPSAVSPPAPTPTGSNGSIVNNDALSATIMPGSVTAPGGGVKMSGPAAANGSPAPMAPNMNVLGIMKMAVAAGYDANQAGLIAQSYLANLHQQGILDDKHYRDALAGSGAAQPLVADIGAAATVKGHQIMAGAELEKQRMVTGEMAREFGLNPKAVIDTKTGLPVNVPPQDAMGRQPYEPAVAVERQRQQGEYGTYYDRTNPTLPLRRTAATADIQNLQPAMSQDVQGGSVANALMNEPDPAKREQIIQRALTGAAIPKGPTTPKDSYDQLQVNSAVAQREYPQPDPATKLGLGEWHVTEPSAFTPRAEAAIDQKQEQLRMSNRVLAQNPTALRSAAIRTLQAEKTLPTPQEVNELRQKDRRALAGGDTRVQMYPKGGVGAATPHMMIDLKNAPAGAVPSATSVPPPGAVGRVPEGTPNGPFQASDGRTGNVVNGYFVPNQ